MSLKHADLVIDDNDPFANCKLDRKKYADILTQIIDTCKDGFVLALNNKWGTGKTTFVKMWERQLINEGYKTVYFNAWENDFEDNALTALMGELNKLSDDSNKQQFKEVLQKGAIIAKNVLPGLIKAVVAKYIDIDELKDYASDATKGLTEIFEEDVKQYTNRKNSIYDFKDKLKKFISETNDGKPLIFIIDELDRCRPNYSVSVLEQIKHFFSVQNIIFILSIDKEQLGNAVKGVYGTDSIDSEEYLRRFIDVEYNMPIPNSEEYTTYLYNYYNFKEFFSSSNRNQYHEFQSDEQNFIKVAKLLFGLGNISLRQQHKIFSHCRLVLGTFNENQYILPIPYIFTIFLRELHKSFYNKLVSKEANINDVQQELKKITRYEGRNIQEKNLIEILEAYIIYLYYNYCAEDVYKYPLISYEERGNPKLKFTSIFDSESRTLIRILDYITSSLNIYDLSFEYLFKKIDLMESIKIR